MTAERAIQAYTSKPVDENELIKTHSGLIDRCAHRLTMRTGMYDMFDDLWVSGAMALLDAHRRFDTSRGIKFETFAEHRIRGSMLDEMRKQDHLPRRLRAQTEGMKNARKRLANDLGREPTNEELCEELEIDIAQLGNLQGLTQPIVDIQKIEPYHEEQDTSPFTLLENKELKALVTRSIGTLPERLQLVLSLHYVEALTYREIAGILGVSEPRVCQLHGQAIKLVRENIEAEENDD
ncbi:MAG: FliA/WhiG family RNA polymerase sigma factor [Myxococcales bacterium]|nr:FliA/WhiG family RNA polymerase sigma factor [Myxococcales bacterium]|tara:strand:- start:736 stop:1446 length:711 start_codon:yes stop_codon:yes gene_type:complete